MKKTLLIIDDEKDIVRVLRDTLLKENFNVLEAYTGETGIKTAVSARPNLILLDLRLPDFDGVDVCRQLRQNIATAQIPIIMLTTRSTETEKVVGLVVGADDYITKPFNSLELVARINAVLRRMDPGKPVSATAAQVLGDISINCEARSVAVHGKPVKLTRKEFDVLAYLMSNVGKALRRTALLEAVWGESYDTLQGTVDTHIKSLRKKLGAEGKRIETLPGIGYRLSDA